MGNGSGILRSLAVPALLSIAVLAGGCGGSGQTQANAGASGATYTMKIGHTLSQESPRHKVLEEFKKQVEQQTNGQLQVEIFPSNQLGDNNQLLQAVPLGNIEAAVQPTAFFGGVQNKLSVVDLPFLWQDMEHIGKVITSDTGDKILAPLEEKGIKGLALWPIGMKVITSNKPIHTIDAFQGQKFRTMGTPVLLDTFTAWGTNPTVIAIPELYSSLQQGVVEGEENDIGTIHDLKLYEVQKYMLETYHGAVIDVFYVNKKWFDGLPADIQQAVTGTAKELIQQKIQRELEEVDRKMKTIKESGKMQISQPSEPLLQELKQKAEPIMERFLSQYPDLQGIVEEIKKQ